MLEKPLVVPGSLSQPGEGLDSAETDGADLAREVGRGGGEVQAQEGAEVSHLASVVLGEVQVGGQDIRGQTQPAPG